MDLAPSRQGLTVGMRTLTVNAGSSSLKLRLLDEADRSVAAENLDAPGGEFNRDELHEVLVRHKPSIDAIGYRVVHGGKRFASPIQIDDDVLRGLRELVELAPLHEPASLAVIDFVSSVLPGVPSVASFDTAFHSTLPPAASTYALPRSWRDVWGIRRYGFHGLSHSYACQRASEMVGVPLDQLRIVSCHLGAGASLAAVKAGRSIDTTMGFTPLEGLVMATRSGSVDPGTLIWLLESGRIDASGLSRALQHESGITGLAGSGDMRVVEARAGEGDADAALALEVYGHRLRASIASMAAAMDGIDVLVFTGGVGEHSSVVRAGTIDGLKMFGAQLDVAANAAPEGDSIISPVHSQLAVAVVEAREDIVLARNTRSVLDQRSDVDAAAKA